MGFVEAVKSVYGSYAKFSGRARRSEFWWFLLFYLLAYVVIFVVMAALGTTGAMIGILLLVGFVLASFIPYLAVVVRRLHDTDRSGWWLLLSLIPFGGFVLLVLMALPGSDGPNKYGPDPRETTAYAQA
jgi:uncharacterized membrane protein YhaH (DUF805 family)